MSELINALLSVVSDHPGLTGREIADYLYMYGFPEVTRTDVNQILYAANSPCYRIVGANRKPAWYLRNGQTVPREDRASMPDQIQWSGELRLYSWQKRALDSWQREGYKGVIEAVTGTGKTHIALAAMEAHLRRGWRIAVIVPSIALQKQWMKVIKQDIVGQCKLLANLGLLGGGHRDSLGAADILVGVASSASKHLKLPKGYSGLLIADECHHYGAETWSGVLDDRFDRRMGLTATYERQDAGIDDYLDPYFGGICFSLGYDEALQEDAIAEFKIAFVGVRFDETEMSAYEESDSRCKKLRQVLINEYNVSPEPFGEFMKEVDSLAAGGEGEATGVARGYLTYFSRRRDVLACAVGKISRLANLVPAICAAERTILFTQTKKAAEEAVNILKGLNVRGAVLDASMDLDERKIVFAAFEDGEHELVAAPMLLDEGVDVPSADLAIVLAASRSRRQMIQRMGRVLRNKKDGRLARIVILFVEGTSEDPDLGAYDTFVDMITDAASDVQTFSWQVDGKDICEYVNDWETIWSMD